MSTHGPGGPTDTPPAAPAADHADAAAGRALVEFWGTRGSIPTPGSATQRYGGNSSCVALDFGGELFICDAGTGIRALGVELARNATAAPVRAHLFFSHSHWDHIQGFPFFTPAYDPRSRITVYGNHAGPGCMYDLLSGQMQAQYFPVSFRDLGAVITRGELGEPEGSLDEGTDEAEAPTGRAAMASVGLGRLAEADEALQREGVEINGVRVRIFRGRHPGGCIAYRFEHQGLSVVYSTDN
jgi:phosphoribosyl 1,2-cyclic phosphodiesterase